MTLSQLLRYLSIDPVSLSLKEKGIAACAGFIAILSTGLLTRAYAPEQSAILVASMGASAAILFAIPGSPLAQPWPFAGGQLLSAVIGVSCAAYIEDIAFAAATSAGLAILLMLFFRCLHPPGAATALAPVLSGTRHTIPDLDFVMIPVGANVLLMLILAWLINGYILRRNYPARLAPPPKKTEPQQASEKLSGISQSDVEQVTRHLDHFLDIGNNELLKLFNRLQLLAFQKQSAQLSCGDIMQRDIVTVEYSTEVETAWSLMHERQLKALPVLDSTRRVIGIVTRYDFLKNLKMTPYRSFQEKWLAFVKTSPTVATDKPEAVGHIMTRKVKTLPATCHIAELLPLVVDEGHHHVPIVDAENRFVGMVFQSRLMSALFHQIHCTPPPPTSHKETQN